MLQFFCRFAFESTFRLSNRTPKITQILKIMPHTAVNMAQFSKENKISIKRLSECKDYSAWQFITEFTDKDWTNNSINRLPVKLRKFGTV